MAAILTNAPSGPFVTGYVPGEICLVLSFRTAPSGSGLYERVASWFNQAFPKLLEEAPGPGRRPLSADLYPGGLRHRFRGVTTLLRPITSEVKGSPDPFTHLVRPRGRETSQVQPFRGLVNPTAAAVALYFYTFGDPSQGLRARHDDVRELARLVNSRLVGKRQFGQPAEGVDLESACPNWMVAVTGNDSGCCPGAPPVPAPAGDHLFLFPNTRVNELLKGGDEQSPLVAVIDASPNRLEIEAAIARYPGNRLLKAISANLGGRFVVPEDTTTPPTPPAPPSLSREALNDRVGRYVPAWHEELRFNHSFQMADHGFFVAGIVHDLAPHAQIHLIRALNDHGVADFMSLAFVVRQLPDLAQKQERRALIVNMSLGFDLQPGDQGLEFWLPLTFGDLVERGLAGALREDVSQTLAGVNRAAAEALRLAHLNLALTISWLAVDQGALIVASAGNDYDAYLSTGPTEARVEPRFPARYDHAFGIAAVDHEGRPSEFANRGDVKALVNGVAAFGGNAHRPGPRMMPRIGGRLMPITGVYSAEKLPIDNLVNTTGWVHWAGSSFSAPIVSALAARLWNTLPAGQQNATAVMLAVRTALTTPLPVAPERANQLDVPTIVTLQT
ncbi:MAG TPA: S8/S53 family peptidase [Chloroflexota bacterium]|jgi:hypothetical protein